MLHRKWQYIVFAVRKNLYFNNNLRIIWVILLRTQILGNKMVRAWYMDNDESDQRLEHHQNPPKFVDLSDLFKKTGVEYFEV